MRRPLTGRPLAGPVLAGSALAGLQPTETAVPAGHSCPPGWVPASPCTSACLPPVGAEVRLRVARRVAALVCVLLAAIVVAPMLAPRARGRWLSRCCRALLRALGITLRVHGDHRFAAEGGVLVVANHLSWMDVLALTAVQPIRMLAKQEVQAWPVVGTLASWTGSLFVDRAGLRALPATVEALTGALHTGACVGVFPEGTTWCGAAGGPFRRAAFQAALDAGAPVRPVAIRFRGADGSPARTASFVGEQSLLDSLLRAAREPGLVCELTVQPLLSPHGDRRSLALRAATAVSAATGVPHPDRGRPASARRTVAA